jgi:hypothetical protein
LTNNHSKLAQRIRFHYEKQTNIEKFMDIIRAEAKNFEPIPYTLLLEDVSIPENDFDIDDLAQQIGKNIVDREFSNFIFSLKKVPCKTVKTTLDKLTETLDQTHDELWDLGLGAEQLFMPWVLKNEIRQRKQSVGIGINFSTRNLKPILSKDLGHSQIIFANKHCFGKTYPMTIDKQILVSARTVMRKTEIDCQIIQNLHFRNLASMRRIVVIDAENSDFLNPDKWPSEKTIPT